MSKTLRKIFYEPQVKGIDVDDKDFLEVHRNILERKQILQNVFADFYRKMGGLCDSYLAGRGLEIELGSGAGFIKKIRPTVKTSDIRASKHIDLVIDAQDMDLEDASVRCIYAINVFHHIPEPRKFFDELRRVLEPDGGCILVEPHNGIVSAALHKRLHKDEFFDAHAKSWENNQIQGPLSGANQALSHIVFVRDIKLFETEYGNDLELVYRGYCLNGIRYLLSGGLNFRQVVPSFFEPLIRGFEFALRPLSRHWSLHHVIVIRKKQVTKSYV